MSRRGRTSVDKFKLAEAASRGCGSKKPHATQEDAEEAADVVYRVRGLMLKAYHCKWCWKYHLTKDRGDEG